MRNYNSSLLTSYTLMPLITEGFSEKEGETEYVPSSFCPSNMMDIPPFGAWIPMVHHFKLFLVSILNSRVPLSFGHPCLEKPNSAFSRPASGQMWLEKIAPEISASASAGCTTAKRALRAPDHLLSYIPWDKFLSTELKYHAPVCTAAPLPTASQPRLHRGHTSHCPVSAPVLSLYLVTRGDQP